jgi:flagellar biogenesis protein FliO
VNATSFLTVMLALAVVLAAMGVALKFLRRYTMGGSLAGSAVKMEVVQRLTLGQRQGLAVVRVGSRIFAVSMGDGGVHAVAELDESDLAAPESPTTMVSVAAAPQKIANGLRKLALLRSDAAAEPAPARIDYVAPMEDFEAVLSMAMGGSAR